MKDLQNHMFETIERLKSNNDPKASDNEKMDISTAKAICQAAAVIIESAKAENEFLSIVANAQNPNLLSFNGYKTMLSAHIPPASASPSQSC